MARQLDASGDEVNALVLVDLGPPGVERPKIKPLSFITMRVRHYLSDGRMRNVIAWESKNFLARVFLRHVGPSIVRLKEEVNAAHRVAYRTYRGGHMKRDVTLVLSTDSVALVGKEWYGLWSELIDGQVTTRIVNGTHANLLVEPFVRELAIEISNALGAQEEEHN